MKNLSSLKKIKLKRWELSKAILEVIVIGLVSGGGHPLKPTLPLMIDTIAKLIKGGKQINIEEEKIKRVLKNLEKRDIISLKEKGGKIFVHTVNNHHHQVIKYSIKILLDFKKKTKKWNGKWFMVFFDVPEIQRNKRDYLRGFLVKLGFYPYQKSVYLFPYECEKEVSLIKKIVEGAKYMKYIVAEKIEDEKIAKIFFNLP
jgi:CRISPR-associated endonuclease Cas2